MTNVKDDKYNDMPDTSKSKSSAVSEVTNNDDKTWYGRLMKAISELEYLYSSDRYHRYYDIGKEEVEKIKFLFVQASKEKNSDLKLALFEIFEVAKLKHSFALENNWQMDDLLSPNMESLVSYCQNFIDESEENSNE